MVMNNGKIYKFLEIHLPGSWNDYDNTETDFFYELSGITGESLERLHINLQKDGSALSNFGIVISFSDGSTSLTANSDSEGNAIFNIPKGKIYSIEVTDLLGYHNPSVFGVEAKERDRYITLSYTSGSQSKCNLNVYLSTNGSLGDFINGNAVLYLKQGTNILGNTLFNSSGIGVFENLDMNAAYTLEILITTTTPNQYALNPKNIITKFQNQNIIMEANLQTTGIFLVDTDWIEHEVTPDFINTLDSSMKGDYVAFHICLPELWNSRNDYYVRCKDLTSERTITSKQWSTSSVTYPSVEMNDTLLANLGLNGRQQTYFMLKDAKTLGIQSPAAQYATSQTLVLGDQTLYGFMGTAHQMNYIFTDPIKTLLTNVLTALGYTNPNFTSTNIWSSSQRSYIYSWFWGSGGNWNTYYASYGKTDSFSVLPLFAPY